ncbi:hypothetical protein BaRGS_00034969 [Batillaria attramentaria]|uniref:EF-hand domain-containing protein n=1 Tax=Batillaria attramentaria TaxID=370345 RepID=A0ABD0JFW3_9CAEN
MDQDWVGADVKGNSPVKRHPSFDTWISGSPHDSDEYDTDLEEKEAKLGQKQKSPPKSDGTGAVQYEALCRKHGFIPISYLRRHLGKRNIRMRHHYLGGRAARPLAAAFRHNTITETLDLSDNYLESTGANLSNNFIESYGCKAMADMLDSNTTLKSLSLAGNRLMDRDAYYFIEPLKNNLSLVCLDLSNNDFGEMGGLHLGAAVGGNDSISELDLSWNAIRGRGAVAFANALKVNTFLEVLDLAWNGFGGDGTIALGQALMVNTYIRVLDLTNNRIDKPTAIKFGNSLKKNYGLETLILNLNPLGDQGIESILKAADVHPSLKFLSVEEMGINPENLHHIMQLQHERGMIILHGGSGGYQRNTSLQSVLRLLKQFAREHMADVETAFQGQDKERSGILTAEETKMCLRSAGLRLTGRQLDLLIEEIDFSHSGHIRYREILSGKLFAEYHKRRPSRGFNLQDEPMIVQNLTSEESDTGA